MLMKHSSASRASKLNDRTEDSGSSTTAQYPIVENKRVPSLWNIQEFLKVNRRIETIRNGCRYLKAYPKQMSCCFLVLGINTQLPWFKGESLFLLPFSS